ncbi:hypothetical protein SAMN05877838_3310 [Hoeflea halophila]|uniref:DUF937 domain-containing protein n=1 Tax=Hoeflea halophila TaxID=714899 RepID=A0A286IED2_9HYPH|nr:DUF937 domain-containing protein [Hoeflea halophila]SOE18387.1 hypothetical protein SAMN05877838_3310 [Hoeflea halophila]
MMPLYDMMMRAQNGEAMRAMAKQFGLNEAQMDQAMAALMPAFSTALKRNVSNPMDMSNFLSALAGGNHAQYFENIHNAFTPQGMQEGNGILGHLFGSREVSRAVAAQAEAATGIGREIYKQMLPMLATAIMGGLFKQSTAQETSHAQSSAMGGVNPIGDLISEMMRQGMGGARAKPTPKASPMDNPLGQVLEGMFGGAVQQQAPKGEDNPFANNPLGQIFQDMLSGGMGGGQARQAPEPDEPSEPDRMPSGRERNPYDDLFGQMFESGKEVPKGYQKNLESIFDLYLKGIKQQR